MQPYQLGDYSLFARDVVLKNNNGTQRIYFFAKNEPKSGAPSPLPNGYKVEVSPRTGMPLLRKDPNAVAPQMNPAGGGWLKRFFN